MSVRPEFGPTLPALLEARGFSRRSLVLAAAALAVLAVLAFLGMGALRDREHLVVAGPPEFNLVYAGSALELRPPREGELLRLEATGPTVEIELTARRATVPPYENGDVIGGFLPILAEERIGELRAQFGRIGVTDEGKSRIGDQPGYQIGFRASVPGGELFARDAYVFPDDPAALEGLLLSLRRTIRGRQTAADEELFDQVREAFSSVTLGADQP